MPEGGIAIRIPGSDGVRRLDELDGSIEAKYTGNEEVDGRKVAVIEFELELSGDLDIAEGHDRRPAAFDRQRPTL